MTASSGAGSVGPRTGRRHGARHSGRGLTRWLFLLPALVLLAVLIVYPIGDAIRLAFTSWDGFSAPHSIGLSNFEDLLKDKRFKESLLHNLAIVVAIPIWIAVPYAVACGIHTKVAGWRFFRLVFFLPVVLSPVVLGAYYGIVLAESGPLNGALRSVGLGGLAHEWLNDPALTLPVVIGIIIWATFGVGVLIFLAGLANLDEEIVEAAQVDGASRWQIQRHVVFWQLLPVIEFWTVIIVIASFTAFFPLIYTLTKGGPGTATFTVDFDLYSEAFTSGRLGYASAIGVVMMFIILVTCGGLVALLRWRRS
ncbi:MAG: sugar ABC transporter permease [Actinobacteria bacterium]|nr:sugar ABC transporter permease [Actinomycetota bacterium]